MEAQKALATLNDTLNPIPSKPGEPQKRGTMIYTSSQLRAITGMDKEGNIVHGTYDQSLFFLTTEERLMIYRLCVPVQAVVSSRMHTIANMEFDIVPDKKEEDRIAQRLKNLKNLYTEYGKTQEMKYVVARAMFVRDIQEYLPDVLPDLTNFESALIRWKKRLQNTKADFADQIKEWILEPNQNQRMDDFIKSIVFDLMIHGACAVYKTVTGGKIENLNVLPGGTVFPLKNKFVGGVNAYVQMIMGVESAQIFFSNELAYVNYLPTSARAYGFIPLEALINKIIESLFFDRLMADQADGTKPPEKLVIITEQSPFGDLGKEFAVPMDEGKQSRLEEKVNTPRYGAVMTFSGNGVQVVDLSRQDTISVQMQRQKDIREEVGLVFQATPIEMNLAGSENTSGRSTSEIQREMYHSRAVMPIIKIIETLYNKEILPYRYGTEWKLQYKSGKSEMEDLAIVQQKVQTGVYSVNEIRMQLDEDPIPDDQFNKPSGSAQQPSGTESNPFNMRNME